MQTWYITRLTVSALGFSFDVLEPTVVVEPTVVEPTVARCGSSMRACDGDGPWSRHPHYCLSGEVAEFRVRHLLRPK